MHLSDLHAAQLGPNGSALKKVITQKNVSCIVLSGDMVGESGDVDPLLQLLDMTPRDVSVYLIAGDSDPAAAESGSPREHLSLCGLAAGGGGTRGHLPG